MIKCYLFYRTLEILDDTLTYVIIGDKDASAEGSIQGTFNEMATITGFGHLETEQYLTARLDKFGGVEAYNHYAVGWAHAMNTPYQWTKQVAFDDDVWELYDTTKDWSQSNDLAKEMPEKLHELQRLWLIEAVKHNVLALDERFAERANPDLVDRPQLTKGNRQILFGGMGRMTEMSIVNYKNKSHAVTDEVVVPQSGAEGVIVAVGGNIGGWSLYAKEGKPKYCYNFYGLNRYTIEGTTKIPAGKHQVRMEFKYDGGGLAKGGTVTLYVDGKKAGEGRVEQTEPIVFSADETCDVDKDTEDLDHLITPEERLRVAMAIQ